MNEQIIINHAGFTGDLLYCIPMLCELKEALNCTYSEFHIQTNVKSNLMFSHPNGDVRMTVKSAEFIKPLLEAIEIFEKVTYSDEVPTSSMLLDLSKFIQLPINFQAGNIQEWAYNLINLHLPQDFAKKRIFVNADHKFKDRIILVDSERYNNPFLDLNVLKEHKDRLLFIGTNDEYKAFKSKWFDVEYYKISDALEFAKILAGAKGIVSNQTGLYAIAELMKVPRILMTAEFINKDDKLFSGPVNVQPQGGWFELAITTHKLNVEIKGLIEL